MARIRSIHPEIATDEDFVVLSDKAKWFYVLLWGHCDDQGVFEWKPVALKMKIMPADNGDPSLILAELERADKIAKFTHEGRDYGCVRNFCAFQRPKKPKKVYFIPDEFHTYVALSDASSELGKPEVPPVPPKAEIAPQMEDGGKDGEKGRVGRERAPRGARLPADWALTEESRSTAKAKRELHGLPAINLDLEAELFRNHWHSVSGAKGCKADWGRAWVNWCLSPLAGRNGAGNVTPAVSGAQMLANAKW